MPLTMLKRLLCQRFVPPLSGQVMEAAKSNYEHLKNLAFADSNSKVDVLIGANHIWDFSNGYIKRGKHGPVAVETTFGWVLNGPVPMQVSSVSNLISTHALHSASSIPTHENDITQNNSIDESLDKFWVIESTGKV